MNNFRRNSMLVASIVLVVLVSVYSLAEILSARRNIGSLMNDRLWPLEQLKRISDALGGGVSGCVLRAQNGALPLDLQRGRSTACSR